jgi:hypothetical protein
VRVCVCVCVQHVLFAIKFGFDTYVSDVKQSVVEQRKREQYLLAREQTHTRWLRMRASAGVADPDI